MRQYEVVFWTDYTEIVEAYGFRRHGNTVTFDLGRGSQLTLHDVKRVNLLGIALEAE